jgi:hypothetical protein
MRLLKRHAVFTAVAIVIGSAAVFWVQPTTKAGTILIIAVCLIIINALAAIAKS